MFEKVSMSRHGWKERNYGAVNNQLEEIRCLTRGRLEGLG